ncbi:hypothetical protein V6N13_132897 [Hibiscus sabdariffa]|uniref:IST1-like protein n=1 Tax=Hibiscus sabdariffa TaxID=183260 RepID=A0ABR2PWP5_9ROSI
MFNIYFGWQKASKCKKLTKLVQCRLKLLKNKRSATAKLLREDLAKVIELSYEEIAFKWAEQLVSEYNMMAVYDILDRYCEFIYFRLPYIRRHKDCPDDINEAVSSLIFASARCAGLPELAAVRKLFRKRYGHGFETSAVELLPGNMVNREIRELLSMKSVSDDRKHRLIDEIAREYCCRPQPEILALEFSPQVQPETEGKAIQVVDPPIGEDCDTIDQGMSMEPETEGKTIQVVDPPIGEDCDTIDQGMSMEPYQAIGSNSSSTHRPNYVHPKLPEYEDVAAKLMALKMEHLLHKRFMVFVFYLLVQIFSAYTLRPTIFVMC